jgi:hypothetical protein
LASGCVVLIAFAVTHAAVSGLAALVARAPFNPSVALATIKNALILSTQGILFVQLSNWREELGFDKGMPLTPEQYIGLVEGVFGAALWAMALIMLGR